MRTHSSPGPVRTPGPLNNRLRRNKCAFANFNFRYHNDFTLYLTLTWQKNRPGAFFTFPLSRIHSPDGAHCVFVQLFISFLFFTRTGTNG